MTSPTNEQPDRDAALLIACGVNLPPEHVDRIREMYRAGAAIRAAIRALRLGETEPAVIFAPRMTERAVTDE